MAERFLQLNQDKIVILVIASKGKSDKLLQNSHQNMILNQQSGRNWDTVKVWIWLTTFCRSYNSWLWA